MLPAEGIIKGWLTVAHQNPYCDKWQIKHVFHPHMKAAEDVQSRAARIRLLALPGTDRL